MHYLCRRGEELFSWLHPFITCWAMQKRSPQGTQSNVPPATSCQAGKEHPLAQGASLHSSAFIGSLANLTNFEEKSLRPQAAGASFLLAACLQSGEGDTSENPTVAQEEQPDAGSLHFFSTIHYSGNFRQGTGVPAPSLSHCCPQGSSKATSVPAHLAGAPQSKSFAHHLRGQLQGIPLIPPASPPTTAWPKAPLPPFFLIYRRETSEITAVLLSDLAAFSYLLGLRYKLNLAFSR